MHLPRLDADDRVNDKLRALLQHLHPADVAPFVRKFTTQERSQRVHTYRELLFGDHIRAKGFSLRYERPFHAKTPDWVLVGSDDEVIEIIDVTTVHQKREKDIAIGKTLSERQTWSGWITVPLDHVYAKLEAKANTYAKLAITVGKPYVVAAFGEFTASIDSQEIANVLLAPHGGLFAKAHELSGVIYFREVNGAYKFTYFQNPFATYRSALFGTPAPVTRNST